MKVMTRCSMFLASAALALGVAGNAFATTLSVNASPPVAGAVDIRQTSFTDGSDMVRRSDTNDGNHQWFGQTFTVPAGGMSVDKVAYAFQQEVDASGRMTSGMTMGVSFYNLSSLPNITTGTLINSQTAVTPSFTQGANLWMTFDVDDFNLAPGQYGVNFDFAFALNNDNGGHKIGSEGMWYVSDGSDHYSGGQAWRVTGDPSNGNNLTNAGEPRDLAFVITGGPQVIVPEPSAFVLAGLGLVGLVTCARRRRLA